MARKRCALGVAILVTTSGFYRPTHAQRTSRYAFDVTVGVGLVQTTGKYSDRDGGGLAGELAVARRFHSDRTGGLVAVVNGGYYLMMRGGDDCTLYPPFEPPFRCAPQTPDIRLIGVLTGWETRTGWFRATGGLAYADPTSGGEALAIQARLDVAVGIVRHLAVTASVRPVVIPSYRGDTFRLLGIGTGVRIRW